MNQQKITSFFSADKSKQLAKPAKKQEEPFWEPLFYNRKKAFNIVSNLTEIKMECEASYKEKGVRCNKKKIDRVFSILECHESIRLMSLFERDVPVSRKYYKRLANEMNLIIEKNFVEVFIQVKEILSMTTDFPHIIRGSAGCSLVCYLMKITHMDPIKLNINLTRFMHERREDLPDIDIDFPAHRRNEIYERIFKRYRNRVARISNHVMYKHKSAVKEAIRQEGYNKFLSKDFQLEDIFSSNKTIDRVLDRANKLQGTQRCYSLHCGGIVIFEDKIPDEYFLKEYSIFRGKEIHKNTVKGAQIHLNKDEVDDKMLIKIDVLSNNGLSQCITINPDLEIDSFTFDDPKVYEALANGDNLGITYAESRGMNKIFTQLKPKNLEDIAVTLALIRPAAAKNGQKFNFLKNFHASNSCDQRDYIIYDDDAIDFIAKTLKITHSEADMYRKAFAKNKYYLKREFQGRIKKARPQWSAEKHDLIFSQLECLQEYSFCKSHAFSYAMLVYILAYYKIYKPLDFWRATLEHCNTSYRQWTHYRAAKMAGVSLKPYLKKAVPFPGNSVSEYFSNGLWISRDFLPGMYFRVEPHPDREKVSKTGKMGPQKRAYFRGLIATSKIYLPDNKIRERENDTAKRRSPFITFITLGISDTQWIDVVAWGARKLAKVHCFEGFGVWEDDSWVRVENMSISGLS
jgi:DNA polymerase-3 subunit alpha